MDRSLSTEQLGWVLGRSAASIREDIRGGTIAGTRIPQGFRIPREEAIRLARDKVEAESDRRVSDRDLERLIDEVIATNEGTT